MHCTLRRPLRSQLRLRLCLRLRLWLRLRSCLILLVLLLLGGCCAIWCPPPNPPFRLRWCCTFMTGRRLNNRQGNRFDPTRGSIACVHVWWPAEILLASYMPTLKKLCFGGRGRGKEGVLTIIFVTYLRLKPPPLVLCLEVLTEGVCSGLTRDQAPAVSIRPPNIEGTTTTHDGRTELGPGASTRR